MVLEPEALHRTAEKIATDEFNEISIRPNRLADYQGQANVVQQMKIVQNFRGRGIFRLRHFSARLAGRTGASPGCSARPDESSPDAD